MSADLLAALAAFALVASVTPGPNNLMLLASGVNFGLRRTVPHMAGIAFGFCVLLLAVGFGLGALFERVPAAQAVLKLAGGSYLLFLAWKIGTARSMGDADGPARPISFLQASAFQFLNPKGWVAALAAMAAYTTPQDHAASVVLVTAIFMLVGVPSILVWAGFGVALRTWLSDPVRLKRFNIGMAGLLVLSLWPMLR